MIDNFISQIKLQINGAPFSDLDRFPYRSQLLAIETAKSDIDIYACALAILSLRNISLITPITTYLYDYYSNLQAYAPTSAQCLSKIKDEIGFLGMPMSKQHGTICIEPHNVSAVFTNMLHDTSFQFSNWLGSHAGTDIKFQPLGVLAEKFLTLDFFQRHASNVGVILRWDTSFMDIDNSKYRLIVIDRWDGIIHRMEKKFARGGKLPRFCYGFNDFYLLHPITTSILRDKQIPDNIFRWWSLWHFRRMWGNTAQDTLCAKALAKSWDRFKETLYREGYKRSHVFNCLMRILHESVDVPITKDQIGELYPCLIKAAIKGKDVTAANFVQKL